MKILLVEDNATLAEALVIALGRGGAEVSLVRSAQSAQAALACHNYGLVLLDLALLDGAREDVLDFMRRQDDITPVIVMTTGDRAGGSAEGFEAGAADCLVNPFHMDELLTRLRAVMPPGRGVSLLRNGHRVGCASGCGAEAGLPTPARATPASTSARPAA